MEAFDSEKTLVFEVPADLTEATLTLAAAPFGCQWAGQSKPYTATGQADVSIKLPAR
jgi:hypothetical protein